MPPTDLSEHLGPWEGTWTTWLDPSMLFDVSPVSAVVSASDAAWTLDYEAHIKSDAVVGSVIYDRVAPHTSIEWTDSWHTSGTTERLVGFGSDPAFYAYTGGDEVWGWTIDIIADPGRLVIVHHNIPPGGPPVRAVTARLRRPVTPSRAV